MDQFLELCKDGKIGWCNIHIGNFESRASYLTDIPIDCLKSAVDYLKNGTPINIHFDADGWEFEVKSTSSGTTLSCDYDDGFTMQGFQEISAVELSKAIYNDISSNIDGWCDFMVSFDSAEREMFKSEIISLLHMLHRLLGERGQL